MNIVISDNFKKMTGKAIFAIIIFIITYLLVLSASAVLMVVLVISGVGLIILKPMFITIALGVGLASVGFFILFFLFKFIFKKHTTDRSHLIEISEQDEPELFALIRDIVTEVNTDFPKKIYLSSEVNASVFYDSTFLSMFLPVKKNLLIGVGLMNSVNVSEFKAILSHEFGHFSQRSMKIGSYVYNVNQIIYNMLFDNDSLNNAMIRWANMSGYFTIFVKVAIWIIESIQWLLQNLYNFVNISYMALSREMEFHADEIAANVVGYEPLKESLLRIDFAQFSLNAVFQFYNGKIEENKTSQNIFHDHRLAMAFLANENDLIIKNGLPVVTLSDINRYNKSRLNIKNQWASHPSTEDRVIALEKTGITKSDHNYSLATSLLSAPERTMEMFTKKLFAEVSYQTPFILLNNDSFNREFQEDYQKNKFPDIYNGYYDNKNPFVFDLNTSFENTEVPDNYEALFSKEKIEMVYDYVALGNDKIALEQINQKEIDVETFDYDGQRYKQIDAYELALNLKDEVEVLKSAITANDINIYRFFYKAALAVQKETELKHCYETFFKTDISYESKISISQNLQKNLGFITVTTPVETILSNFRYTITPHEIELKKEIGLLLNDALLQEQITSAVREQLTDYISKDWLYFKNEKYIDENLSVLFTSMNMYNQLLNNQYFEAKRQLLNFQASIVPISRE